MNKYFEKRERLYQLFEDVLAFQLKRRFMRQMKFGKVKKKSQDKLIKMAGGYTKKEYNRLLASYENALGEKNVKTEAIASANTALYKALCTLESYAKNSLYGKDTEVWAKKMYDCIHYNKMNLLMFYLLNPTISYRIDTSISPLTMKNVNFDVKNPIFEKPMTLEEMKRELSQFKSTEQQEEENIENILDLVEHKKELD